MIIPVNDCVLLSEPQKGDEKALIQWLNDEVIYQNTIRIPYPYKLEHAQAFLSYVKYMRKEHYHPTEWAIRNEAEELIGLIGLSRVYGKYSHKDEIGYWLATPYRGKGIMTEVVGVVSDLSCMQFDLYRLEAPIFPHNPASGKVLEKNGFIQEGILHNYVLKNTRPMDVIMYAKIRSQIKK